MVRERNPPVLGHRTCESSADSDCIKRPERNKLSRIRSTTRWNRVCEDSLCSCQVRILWHLSRAGHFRNGHRNDDGKGSEFSNCDEKTNVL
jgi:hypothetical protein